MKIAELKADMNNVDISGEIIDISPVRDVITKFGNNRVATARIKDDSGEIELSLWGKQIDEFKVGDKIEIKNGYTKSFKDKVQVNVGKSGSIQKSN